MTDPQNWHPPASAEQHRPAYGEYAQSTPPAYGDYARPPLPPGQANTNGWTPPPKPGLIPLRPLGFGTLLWAPFQVLRRNPKATFGSALLVQGAVTLLTLVIMGVVTFFAFNRIASATADEREAVEAGSILTIVLAAIIPIALSVVASALLQGVIVSEVSRATLGEKLRLGQLWRAVSRRLWPLVLWTVLLGLVFLVAVAVIAGLIAIVAVQGESWIALAVVVGILGLLCLFALSAWIFTRTSLVPSLIVLEKLPIRDAMRRSWFLTTGYFWRTLGIQFLVATIINIIAQIVTTPLTFAFTIAVSVVDPNATLDAYTTSIILYVLLLFVTLVMGAIASVVQSATTALIYIDLRMRKEGLDLDLVRFVESAHSPGTQADPYLPGAHGTGVVPRA